MQFFRQCILTKKSGMDTSPYVPTEIYSRLTSWIPEQFAHRGNYVKLKQDDGSWEDGWQISEVGTRLEESFVLDHERDAKDFHKAQPLQRGNK